MIRRRHRPSSKFSKWKLAIYEQAKQKLLRSPWCLAPKFRKCLKYLCRKTDNSRPQKKLWKTYKTVISLAPKWILIIFKFRDLLSHNTVTLRCFNCSLLSNTKSTKLIESLWFLYSPFQTLMISRLWVNMQFWVSTQKWSLKVSYHKLYAPKWLQSLNIMFCSLRCKSQQVVR